MSDKAGKPARRPALSPSRASDFKQCPLLYRFRAVDRLPEKPTKAQIRGTVVHSVLERLFGLPASQRVPDTCKDLLTERPELSELCEQEEDLTEWLASAEGMLTGYFGLEDPRRLEPEAV